MAEEAPDTQPADRPDGVFGNLPGTRPGARSPRRKTGADASQQQDTAAERTGPPPPPTPPQPPPGAERETPVVAESEAGPRISNVEDLAWAGVAVAAQAATLGVRFASRALEAARKSVEHD